MLFLRYIDRYRKKTTSRLVPLYSSVSRHFTAFPKLHCDAQLTSYNTSSPRVRDVDYLTHRPNAFFQSHPSKILSNKNLYKMAPSQVQFTDHTPPTTISLPSTWRKVKQKSDGVSQTEPMTMVDSAVQVLKKVDGHVGKRVNIMYLLTLLYVLKSNIHDFRRPKPTPTHPPNSTSSNPPTTTQQPSPPSSPKPNTPSPPSSSKTSNQPPSTDGRLNGKHP